MAEDKVSHKEMIQMFDTQQKAITEIMTSTKTAINATTKAEITIVNNKLDKVIKHQETQNGYLTKHNEKIKKLNPYIIALKNKKWIIIGTLIIMYLISLFQYNFSIIELFKMITFKL